MTLATNRPSKEEALKREKSVWELRTNLGLSQDQIAAQLGVSQPAVSKILARIVKKVSIEHLENVRQVQAEHIAKLEYTAKEVWAAWHETRDPRFLKLHMEALADIRKIVGAEAAVITKNLNFDIDLTQCTEAELNEIITGKAFK